MKNQENAEFEDVSEKSMKHDKANNLQSNMRQFQRYHIGRNKNMKEAKTSTINLLYQRRNTTSMNETDSKTFSEDLDLSLNSSEFNTNKKCKPKGYQKRTNSEY